MNELLKTDQEKRRAVETFAEKVGYDLSRFSRPDDDAADLVKAMGSRGREVPPLGRAPGVIHNQGEGWQHWGIGNVIRDLVEGTKHHAPAAWEAHDDLMQAGYVPGASPRSIALVTTRNLHPIAGHEERVLRVAARYADAMTAWAKADVDPDEVRWRLKQLFGKAMSPLDETAGGSIMPFPMQGDFEDLLRSRTAIAQAGALQPPMGPGGLHIPRGMTDMVFQSLGPGDTITPSDFGTGGATFRPKKLAAMTTLPNEMLRGAGLPSIEAIIRTALAEAGALAEDNRGLNGAGGPNEPLGLFRWDRSVNDTPTADRVTLHTAKTTAGTGDTFEPEDVMTMIGLIEEAPDVAGATAWILRPLMKAAIANRRADAYQAGDHAGPFMFAISRGVMGAAVPDQLGGLPLLTTTTVPRDMRKGGATNLTAILLGDFRRFLVCRLGALEVALSEHVNFGSDQTAIRAILRSDSGPLRPEVFCVSPTLLVA
jgi:HK97 family phage major capsid protein